MMATDKNKVLKLMTEYLQKLSADDPLSFLLAMCFVQMADYQEAKRLFGISIVNMLKPPMWWKDTSQPNWLVDIYIMSGRTDLHNEIQYELDLYKQDYRGKSLVAYYAYGLMELIYPSNWRITNSIEILTKKSKVKDMYAIGQAFNAIALKDNSALNNALLDLLKAHEGMAKYGALRETAEGLICLPAMSITFVGLEKKFEICIENNYLSIDYLEYLAQESVH